MPIDYRLLTQCYRVILLIIKGLIIPLYYILTHRMPCKDSSIFFVFLWMERGEVGRFLLLFYKITI